MQVPPLGNVGLVGRRPELAAISAAAKAAADYRPSVVWIEGDAGWGKTALLRHALRDLPQDFTVVTAEADEFASELSFNVLEQLGVRQATAVFPAGLELLEYLGRLQSAGPVAVVVEDLHWADPESRAALLVAARRLSQDRVLVVVTSRPEPAPDDGWERFRFDPSRCLVVPMTPLSLAEVSEMARASGVSLPAGGRGAAVPPHRRASFVRPDPAQRVLARAARQLRRQPSRASLAGVGHGGPSGGAPSRRSQPGRRPRRAQSRRTSPGRGPGGRRRRTLASLGQPRLHRFCDLAGRAAARASWTSLTPFTGLLSTGTWPQAGARSCTGPPQR